MSEQSSFKLVVHLILKKENKILLLHRYATGLWDGFWGLPTGGVDKEETPYEAVIREAKEELNILAKPQLVTTLAVRTNNILDPSKIWQDVSFFFISSTWEGAIINNEPHKHSELKWFELDELPANIIPMVHAGLSAYQNHLSYSEYS